MANAGASIEAVLTLNATGFQNGITKSIESLNKLNNARSGLTQLEKAITGLESALRGLDTISTSTLNVFSRLSNAINKMANGLKILQSDSIDVVQAVNTMNSIFKAFQGSLSGVTVKLEGVVSSERQLASSTNSTSASFERTVASINRNSEAMRKNAVEILRNMGYRGKLSAEETKEGNAVNRNTQYHQRNANAMSQASARANQLTSATSRLGKAMSSLRMVGSMVGSMLAYNFAHKLLVATGETIHAKSEMEGYFKMLHLSQGEIDGFNQALDRTVAQFQRVNKYSLGETISSIGVEFNLSTQEMEKAMKVTSMITSEYLRAGRNANEASLAVKDVLQGQFQRLSRETGVKGEQLKEAGWSGDTTDVLGLMEALEKVGQSRNWDVFAEKANSLNDILTITQNRFGEFSADLVYSIQPAIIGAFNMMMGTAQKFASAMKGVWEWINGDSIEGQVAKWGLLAGAITGVLSLLVAYRTGAGLLQVAQIGLTRTLASTVLGLNAEQVALYGTRSAIFAKIFGLEAEKVATLSTKDAILSKILGLDAELVAQTSLKQGILDKAFATELESLRLKGATKEEMLNTLALYENQLAQKSSIGLLSAQALKLNMSTYATHGFTVALLEAKTGMEASKIASMGLTKQLGLLIASIGVPTAIVGAFAVALVGLAWQLKQSADAMKKFNNLVKDGKNIIKQNKDIVQDYTKRQATLTEELSKAERGTAKYYQIQEELGTVNKNLTTANWNLTNSIKAVELANSSKAKYEERLTQMGIEQQGKLAEAYMNAGYSARESYEMANDQLLDAQAGAEQLRQTLQKVAVVQYKGLENQAKLLSNAKQFGLSDEDNKEFLDAGVRINVMMQKGLEKGMTDESFMGRLDGWLGYYEGQILNWFNNLGQAFKINDIGVIWDNIWRGIAHGFADLPFIKDFWNWVYDQTGAKNLKGKGWDLLKWIGDFDPVGDLSKWFVEKTQPFNDMIMNFFKDPLGSLGINLTNFDLFGKLFDGFFKPVSAENGEGHLPVADEMYQVIVQPIVDWWNGFMADPLSYIGNALQYTGIGSLVSALLGGDAMDFSWAWDWLNNNIITPIQTQFNMFLSDPLSYISGAITGGIGGLINALIPNDGGASIWEYVQTSIIQPFTTAIQNGIASIPIVSNIAQMLGLIPQQDPNAQDKGSQLMRAFGNAVENTIGQIPILGDILRMLGIIPQSNPTASSNGQGVGTSIKDGLQNGINGIVNIINTEMGNVVNAISNWAGQAYATACDIGNKIVEGVKSAMQINSPGILATDIIWNEFHKYIPESIMNAGSTAYETAQYYATQIKQGITDTGTTTIGMDGMVADYETDAQMIASSSEMMGMTTTTAFNDMAMQVNSSTSTMGANLTSTYNSISTNQGNMLNNMKTKNTSAYNEMYQKSNQSLMQMRDSTSNITHQMTNAWNLMKNNIVASANQLKNDSTVHFNSLSDTIGGFYRKIQNPSSWGGSPHGGSTHRNVSAGRRIASSFTGSRRYAGGRGSSIYKGSNTMTIASLKKKICPNGDCAGIFDGFSSTDRVDVRQFLSMIDEGGFGSWYDWHGTHYNYIKDKSDQWSMKSPTINLAGGIPTNADYKVGDFENGTPQISFASFQSMAESIFSAIPYRFYYNSDWKGSWLGALQAGACNCWDGANALIAFASSCGFSGHRESGTWVDPDGTTYPHVYAVINGKKMDTTGWQQRGSWSAGSPNIRTANAPKPSFNNNKGEKVINVTIDMSNSTIYGVDDLDSRIQDGVKKGLQEEFNDPYTVVI